eukprot:PhM_4_TR18855/c1_g2_i1/m.43476
MSSSSIAAPTPIDQPVAPPAPVCNQQHDDHGQYQYEQQQQQQHYPSVPHFDGAHMSATTSEAGTHTSGPQTQALVFHPLLKTVLRIPHSKIVRTAGCRYNGAPPLPLCLEYARTGHCNAGELCRYAHIPDNAVKAALAANATMQLDCGPPPDGNGFHPEGWTLRALWFLEDGMCETLQTGEVQCPAFCARMYKIPSNEVLRTVGSMRCCASSKNKGPPYRASLCPEFCATETCVNGGMCVDVHVPKATLAKYTPLNVHFSNYCPAGERNYFKNPNKKCVLPGGRVLQIYDPNLRNKYTSVDSCCVLRTAGAESWWDAEVVQGTGATKRLFHCAHFFLHGLCERGSACTFLHVLPCPPKPFSSVPGCPGDVCVSTSTSGHVTPAPPGVVQTTRHEPYSYDSSVVEVQQHYDHS